jgi:hypothetical protein
MRKKDLPRHRKDYVWAHPYGHGPLSPVLYADGGAGDGGGSGSSSGDGGGDGGQGGSGDGGAGGNQGGGGEDLAAELARLKKANDDLRKENAKDRTTAKENAAKEAREQLLKDLGLSKPDEAPDPAKLAAELGEKDARLAELAASARTQAIELAIHDQAGKHGADPKALRDSVSFLKSTAGLDPTAADFGTKLDDAIKAAVEGNTQLRAVPGAPRRGGGDFAGGPGTEGRATSLGQAVAASLAGG